MSFDELLEPWTADESRAFLRELVITSPAQISATVLDTPTTSEAAIVHALGSAEATRSSDRAFFARSAARSTATAPYLRIISNESFSLPPKLLTFGTTTIVLANGSDSFYGPYDPGQFVVRNSNTKKLYANVSGVAGIPSGTSGMEIGVIALEAGTDSDALPGEITELETPLGGVTITNPAAAIAQDEESAESLNDRIDKKIGSLGTPGARGWATGATETSFEAVAQNGPEDEGGCRRDDGSLIEVTRTQLVSNTLTGANTLYLADNDGPLINDDVVIVRSNVQTYAEWLTVEVDVENSTLVTITYTGTLNISAKGVSATDDEIRAEMQTQLTALARLLKVGEAPAYDAGRDAILDAGNAGKATAFRIKEPGLVLSSPLAYAALSNGQVANLVLGTMTIVRS